jgi:hypothetical protein
MGGGKFLLLDFWDSLVFDSPYISIESTTAFANPQKNRIGKKYFKFKKITSNKSGFNFIFYS